MKRFDSYLTSHPELWFSHLLLFALFHCKCVSALMYRKAPPKTRRGWSKTRQKCVTQHTSSLRIGKMPDIAQFPFDPDTTNSTHNANRLELFTDISLFIKNPLSSLGYLGLYNNNSSDDDDMPIHLYLMHLYYIKKGLTVKYIASTWAAVTSTMAIGWRTSVAVASGHVADHHIIEENGVFTIEDELKFHTRGWYSL